MKNPPPDKDAIASIGAARAARDGINCPVCGRWKRAGALLCHDCMAGVSQPTRNEMAAGLDSYIEVIRDLRCQRAVADLGLKVVRD